MHRFLEATAGQYMTREVKTVSRDTTMRELQAETGWNFEWLPRESVAAWIERHSGHPLRRGETYTVGDYHITAEEVSAERLRRVKLERLPDKTAEERRSVES